MSDMTTFGASYANGSAAATTVAATAVSQAQIFADLVAANAAVGTAIAAISPVSANPTQAATIISAITAAQAAASAFSATLDAGDLANLAIMQRYANGLAIIAQNVQNGQAPKTVTVLGSERLDRLAAMYYGDFTLGSQLGTSNGIIGMRIPAGISLALKLPNFTASA